MKSSWIISLTVAFCFMLGATDSSARYTSLNHRLMCTFGCSELLGECNHVGCQWSGQELNEPRAEIARGSNNKEIFAPFATRYGATVLAAPTTHGFDLVAWIAPFAVFAAALLGTILLIRRWRDCNWQSTALHPPSNESLGKQIRRETGGDGGR